MKTKKKVYELLPDIFGEFTAELAGSLPDGISFRGGALLDSSQLPPSLEFFTGHSISNPPRGLLGLDIPVMSDELIAALSAAGVSNLQAIPALLKSTADGRIWHEFKAVNIVGLVACADLGRSDYMKIMDRPGVGSPPLLGFVDLKLDVSKAGDSLMFRLGESPGIVLVSESVVDSLLAIRSEDDWGITFTQRT